MRRPWRQAAAAAAALSALCAAGCGIRGTSVPVDAGPAPSRASCQAPGNGGAGSGSARAVGVTIYLICSTQLLPVDRTVPIPESRFITDRLSAARAVMAQLQAEPSAGEENAGFATEVPGALTVSGPRGGDPAATLRLNRQPDELPPFALAQLVCTYAGTKLAAADHSVVLGGPTDEPPRAYACTTSVRSRPDVAQPTGTPVH